VTGWSSKALSLGATEALTGSVEQTLRFDDVFYREYRDTRSRNFSVYVAYWNPGKMPVQLVASHTPDRCWSENGWTCKERQTDAVVRSTNTTLPPAQGRLFTGPNGVIQHVAYWHLVGDELYDYGDRLNRVPNPLKWWREVARQFWRRPQEQYFVRLSSERPFDELRGDLGFEQVLEALAKLGLRERVADARSPSGK
jgi:hypothetical protein